MTDVSQMDQDERNAYLETVMDELILKIMINLNERGFSTAEILAALDDICDKRHHEYQEGSDSGCSRGDEIIT